MFEIGWSELLVIGIVALIVIGPRDLPEVFRQLGRFTAKLRGMAREFSRAMEQAAKESGVSDVANDLKSATQPVSTGLNGLKSAADRFEKWDPVKNAVKPTVPPATVPPVSPAPLGAALAAEAGAGASASAAGLGSAAPAPVAAQAVTPAPVTAQTAAPAPVTTTPLPAAEGPNTAALRSAQAEKRATAKEVAAKPAAAKSAVAKTAAPKAAKTKAAAAADPATTDPAAAPKRSPGRKRKAAGTPEA